MEVRFIFTTASGKRRTVLKPLPLVIGRSTAADLKIPGACEYVSRRHCEVLRDDQGRVCIRDLDSTNGTFIAGEQVAPGTVAAVTSGAGVRLGDVSFRIEYPVVAGSAAARNDRGETDERDAEAAAGPPLPATEPLPDRPPLGEVQSSGDGLPSPELEPDEPAGGDFGFLAAAEPAAPEADWPVADVEPTADEAKLGDFFKGLS